MLSLGTIFSLCAGILIGLKLYYRYFCKTPDEKKAVYLAEDRKRMQEIIDQQKYGVILPKNGERLIELGDGKFLFVDGNSARKNFWRDLWYGSEGS